MRQRPPADESGHAIVDFLDEHRLPHSPENYGFAHTYFEGADEAHFMAVANLIDGGYRLRQEDVRAISAPADLHGTATTIGELSTEVMHIIGATAQEANAFVKGTGERMFENARSHDCHPRRWPSLFLRWPQDQRSH